MESGSPEELIKNDRQGLEKFRFFNSKTEIDKGASSLMINIPSDVNLKAKLFDVYATLLSFPYFGYNWDALIDCLRDLGWIPERDVVIVHEGLPLSNDIVEQKIYLSALVDAIDDWQQDVNAPHTLTVWFPAQYKEQIDLLWATHQTEEKLLELLNRIRYQLPPNIPPIIEDFAERGEWSKGYQMLCTQLHKSAIAIPENYYKRIAAFGRSIGIPENSWSMLRQLIRDI